MPRGKKGSGRPPRPVGTNVQRETHPCADCGRLWEFVLEVMGAAPPALLCPDCLAARVQRQQETPKPPITRRRKPPPAGGEP